LGINASKCCARSLSLNDMPRSAASSRKSSGVGALTVPRVMKVLLPVELGYRLWYGPTRSRQSARPKAKVVGRASTACLAAFENRPLGVQGRIRCQPKTDGRRKYCPAQLRFSLESTSAWRLPRRAPIQATYSLVELAETNIMGQPAQRSPLRTACLVNLGVPLPLIFDLAGHWMRSHAHDHGDHSRASTGTGYRAQCAPFRRRCGPRNRAADGRLLRCAVCG